MLNVIGSSEILKTIYTNGISGKRGVASILNEMILYIKSI